MTVRVLSFDFDGSLFHDAYISSNDQDVVASNRVFLNKLRAKNFLYTKTIALIGSNRQSKQIDDANLLTREFVTVGSCFPAIEAVADYLDAELDTFLLADLHNDLRMGTSFTLAKQSLDNPQLKQVHARCVLDETKASLLYAQIHKTAQNVAHLNEAIEFHFYDDREDILDALHHFYSKYSNLLPDNVILCLHEYAGQEVRNRKRISGTGYIDAHYAQTVKDMVSIAVTLSFDKSKIYTEACVLPQLLTHRLPLLVPRKQIHSPRNMHGFFNPMGSYPNAYTAIWESIEAGSSIRKAKALLKDYTKEDFLFGSFSGRVVSGHWNRNHVDQVNQILAKTYNRPEDIIFDLEQLKPVNGGSLFRRIEFIKKQLNERQQQSVVSPFN